MRVKVMYMLEPTEAWKEFKTSPRPAQKRDHNGQLMFEKWPRVGDWPRPLLDYQVLPDTVQPPKIGNQVNTNVLTDFYE